MIATHRATGRISPRIPLKANCSVIDPGVFCACARDTPHNGTDNKHNVHAPRTVMTAIGVHHPNNKCTNIVPT